MKKFIIIVVILGILGGCGYYVYKKGEMSKNFTTIVDSDVLLYPFDMSKEQFDNVVDNAVEYEVCMIEQRKNLTKPEMFSDELLEKYDKNKYPKYDIGCIYQCERFIREGYCEHLDESLEKSKINAEQSELVQWCGETLTLSMLKTKVITKHVYFNDDPSKIKLWLKYLGMNKEELECIVTYNMTENKITDIR